MFRSALLASAILLATIFSTDAGFYPKDVKSLQRNKDLYHGGVRAFAGSMELAVLSHFRRGLPQTANGIAESTLNSIAHIARLETAYVPNLDDISRSVLYDDKFQCFVNTYKEHIAEAEKEFKSIAEKQRNGEVASEPSFKNLATKNWKGALKLTYKAPPTFLNPEYQYGKLVGKAARKYVPGAKNMKTLWAMTDPKKFFKAGKGGSKIARALLPRLQKINKAFYIKGGLPIADIITLGFSAKTLHDGLNSKPPNELAIARGAIGIAGSLLGIGFFLLGASGLVPGIGQIGFCVGLIFWFISALLSMQQTQFEKEYAEVKQLWNSSLYEVPGSYRYLRDVETMDFNDVYAANQAALLNWKHITNLDVPVTVKNVAGLFSFKARTNSQPENDAFQETEEVTEFKEKLTEYFQNEKQPTFLPNGYHRFGGDKEVGFDFFGLINDTKEFKGVTVLVYTDHGLETAKKLKCNFNGMDVDTTSFGPKTNNHIVIDDYKLEPGKKIRIKTGSGDDSVNIDGGIDFATSPSERKHRKRTSTSNLPLKIDMGGGRNVLSFQGSHFLKEVVLPGSGDRIFGILYDQTSGMLSYIIQAAVHEVRPFGKVKGATTFVGSFTSDLVVLGDNGKTTHDFEENDKITLKSGNDMDHFTVVQTVGYNTYVIDLTKIPKNVRKEFTIIVAPWGKDRESSDSFDYHFQQPYVAIAHGDDEVIAKNQLVYKNFCLLIYREVEGSLKQMVRVYIRAPHPEFKIVSRGSKPYPDGVYPVLPKSVQLGVPSQKGWKSVRTLQPTLITEGTVIKAWGEKFIEVARGKPATMSSTMNELTGPEKAVDGDSDTDFLNWKCASTEERDGVDHWWQVNLEGKHKIGKVVIWNRMDSGLYGKLKGAKVFVSDDPTGAVKTLCGEVTESGTKVNTIVCPQPISGQYVRIEHTKVLYLCEVKVYDTRDYGAARKRSGTTTAEGTDHNDIYRMACSQFEHDSKETRTLSLDMKGGTDYVYVSQKFLYECIMDLIGGSEYDEQLMVTKITNNEVKLWIHQPYENKEKNTEIIVKHAEKIVDDYGHELLDIRTTTLWDDENHINLGMLYTVITNKEFGLEKTASVEGGEEIDEAENEREEEEEIAAAKAYCDEKGWKYTGN